MVVLANRHLEPKVDEELTVWRLNRPGKDAWGQMKRDERKKKSLGGLGLGLFEF